MRVHADLEILVFSAVHSKGILVCFVRGVWGGLETGGGVKRKEDRERARERHREREREREFNDVCSFGGLGKLHKEREGERERERERELVIRTHSGIYNDDSFFFFFKHELGCFDA